MLQSMTRNGDAEKSNVTRYFGCWMEGPKVWIVMDYAGGGSVRTLVSGCLFLGVLSIRRREVEERTKHEVVVGRSRRSA